MLRFVLILSFCFSFVSFDPINKFEVEAKKKSKKPKKMNKTQKRARTRCMDLREVSVAYTIKNQQKNLSRITGCKTWFEYAETSNQAHLPYVAANYAYQTMFIDWRKSKEMNAIAKQGLHTIKSDLLNRQFTYFTSMIDAVIALNEGNKQLAIENIHDAKDLLLYDSISNSLLLLLSQKAGDDDLSQLFLGRQVKLNSDKSALLFLARSAVDKKEYAKASKIINRIKAYKRTEFLDQGWSEKEVVNRLEMRSKFFTAMSIEKSKIAAIEARILNDKGDFLSAKSISKPLIKGRATISIILEHSYSLAALGDGKKALFILDQISSQNSDKKRAAYIRYLAAEKAGDKLKAEEWLNVSKSLLGVSLTIKDRALDEIVYKTMSKIDLLNGLRLTKNFRKSSFLNSKGLKVLKKGPHHLVQIQSRSSMKYPPSYNRLLSLLKAATMATEQGKPYLQIVDERHYKTTRTTSQYGRTISSADIHKTSVLSYKFHELNDGDSMIEWLNAEDVIDNLMPLLNPKKPKKRRR